MSRDLGTTAEALGRWVAANVLVPALVMAAVTALLLFLLDLRSLFLDGGKQLAEIGTWFVIATVLIVRHRLSAGSEGAAVYTLGLGLATLYAMMSFSDRTGAALVDLPGPVGVLLTALMVGLVWWFATRLTEHLAIPEDPDDDDLPARADAPPAPPAPPKTGQPASPRAATRTLRPLFVVALIVFALGEALIAQAPAEVARSAALAMVGFLFASGLLFAAAAAVDTERRARSLGAVIPLGGVPLRMLSAAVILVVLLTLALWAPGVRLVGAGDLATAAGRRSAQTDPARQPTPNGSEPGASGEDPAISRPQGAGNDTEPGASGAGKGTGNDQGAGADTEQPPGDGDGNASGGGQGAGGASRGRRASGARARATSARPPGLPLLGKLASLGRWLFLPVAAVLAFGIVVVLGTLWSSLGAWHKRARDGLWRWLARWRERFHLRQSAPRAPEPPPRPPDVAALVPLAPREAILAAYGGLLLLLEHAGHQRPPRTTPHELLRSLPAPFTPLLQSIQQLTELFVAVSYGGAVADETMKAQASACYQAVHSHRAADRT